MCPLKDSASAPAAMRHHPCSQPPPVHRIPSANNVCLYENKPITCIRFSAHEPYRTLRRKTQRRIRRGGDVYRITGEMEECVMHYERRKPKPGVWKRLPTSYVRESLLLSLATSTRTSPSSEPNVTETCRRRGLASPKSCTCSSSRVTNNLLSAT